MATLEQLINTLWKADSSELKERLLNILVHNSYIKGDFTLVSGKKSTFYIDGKQTTLDSEGGAIISVLFFRMLKKNINAVGGLITGICPLASGVSQIGYLLGKNISALYVRKEPKKYGTSKWVEGPLMNWMNVAVLEDVVTTGGSSVKAIEKIKEAGCKVEQVLAIVDRNEGGREAFKKLNLEYDFLFDINEIIEGAKNKK